MKRFLILLGALFIMQTYASLADSANDTIWKKETHYISYLEFSPTNNYFLSYGSHGGDKRKGVIIFNTEGDTIKVIYNSEGLEFRGGQGIWDAHFSQDGRFLVLIWEYDKENMAHGMLEIFETENWTSIKKIDVPGDDFSLLGAQCLISPDNGTIVGITQEGFYFYDVQSGELLKHLWNYGQELNKNIIIASAKYSIDGSHIYFTSTDVNPKTSGDEKLRFLNTQTYEVDYTTDARASRISISKSGNMITKFTEKIKIDLINPQTKESVLTIPVSPGGINSLTFSPDEKYLAVNFGHGKVIKVYDLQTGQSIYEYTTLPTGYALTGIGISPDQKYIVSSSGYIFLYKFLPTTGIDDNPEQKEEIIYPNPANEFIFVTGELLGTENQIIRYRLYNSSGIEVFTIEGLSGQPIIIPTSGLISGAYFLKVEQKIFNDIQHTITKSLMIIK
jgi:WD40 repeat protein